MGSRFDSSALATGRYARYVRLYRATRSLRTNNQASFSPRVPAIRREIVTISRARVVTFHGTSFEFLGWRERNVRHLSGGHSLNYRAKKDARDSMRSMRAAFEETSVLGLLHRSNFPFVFFRERSFHATYFRTNCWRPLSANTGAEGGKMLSQEGAARDDTAVCRKSAAIEWV